MNMTTIGGALFAICTITYFGIQLYIGGTSARMMYEISQVGQGPDDPFAGKVDIENNTRGSKGRLKEDYVKMAAYNDINASRSVNTNIFVPIKKLLNAGEKAPGKDFVDVFLSARAPFVAEQECKALLKTFASQCKVTHSGGKLAHGSREIGAFLVRLDYVAKAPFGEFDPAKKQYFIDLNTILTGNGRSKRTEKSTLSQFGRDRAKIYRKVAGKCAKLRRREGTCATTSIRIQAQWNEKRRSIVYSAFAGFALLSPRLSAMKAASK